MTKPWTLALRADASTEIGVGHVTRVLAVADEARTIGGSPVLFSDHLPEALAKRCEKSDVHVFNSREIDDFVRVKGAFDALLLDGYHFSCEEVKHFSHFARFSTFIDDIGTSCVGGVDLVINPSLGGNYVCYPSGIEVMSSLDYVVVRREVRTIERVPEHERDGILVMLGGSDVSGIKDRIISVLLNASVGKIVVAPGIKPVSDGATRDSRITYLKSFDDVHSAFSQVQATVCAAGGALLEALFLGIPSVGLVVVENQRGALDFVENFELLKVIDFRSEFSEAGLVEAVRIMMSKPQVETNGGLGLRGGIDGRGALRIAETMMARASEET